MPFDDVFDIVKCNIVWSNLQAVLCLVFCYCQVFFERGGQAAVIFYIFH